MLLEDVFSDYWKLLYVEQSLVLFYTDLVLRDGEKVKP